MFGEMPWNDVRISAKKTQHSERVSRAIVRDSDDGKQCKAVTVPGFSDHSSLNSNNQHPSEVQNMLDSLLGMIDPNRHAEGRALVQSLKDCLRLTCERVPRPKGGWQYADSFMLDSVLFADNLRPLHDGDLMQETVKQFLGTRSNQSLIKIPSSKLKICFLLTFHYEFDLQLQKQYFYILFWVGVLAVKLSSVQNPCWLMIIGDYSIMEG